MKSTVIVYMSRRMEVEVDDLANIREMEDAIWDRLEEDLGLSNEDVALDSFEEAWVPPEGEE